jgi:tetratricopeptide (TPR) repeat protein
LRGLESQILDKLKVIHDKNDERFQKKLLYKVYRDLARLYCQKRDEKQAVANHSKAERIMHEDVFPGVECNIKIAKMTLLKGCWLGKLDIEKANDELIVAYHMFDELFE